MRAKITGENEERVGLYVYDNNDTEHWIEMEFNGEIKYSEQDGYPDTANERTSEQGEYVCQARRYAKYYVSQETDYDTLPWDWDPDRSETARQALMELSTAEIEQWFDDLFAQSLSHYADDSDVDIGETARPYPLPTDKIGPEGAVLYKQEIYLDENETIADVSGVIIQYNIDFNDIQTVRHGDSPDREPDAIVEVAPAPLVEYEAFRDYLVYNLRCQIRDCYIGMGLEPPEQYKVLGSGKFMCSGRYKYFDCYPEYFAIEADIDGYTHDFAPELPLSKEEIGGLITPSSSDSMFKQIKNALFSR